MFNNIYIYIENIVRVVVVVCDDDYDGGRIRGGDVCNVLYM